MCASGTLLPGLGDHAELLHHTHRVEINPTLDRLTVPNAMNCHHLEVDLLP